MKKSIVKRFLREERGTAYIMASIAVIPMFGFAALAVDYTNIDRAKTDLETTTQMVALHIAKRVALNPNMASADLVTEGRNLINAVTDLTVTTNPQDGGKFTVDMASGKVQIVAKTDINTHFMHMFGHAIVSPTVKTQAQFGRRNVEVAIAIDNSGSMGDPGGVDADGNSLTKLQAAKKAAEALVNSASGAVADLSNASLKFSIVPWHTHVRLDTSSLAANSSGATPSVDNDNWAEWIDWDGYSTEHFRYLAPFLKNGESNEGDMYYNMNGDNEWKDYDPNKLTDVLPLEDDGEGVDLTALKAEPDIGIVTRKDVFKNLNVEWAGCFDHRAGNYRFSFAPPTIPSDWSSTKNDPTFDGDSLFVPMMAPDERDGGDVNSYLWDDRGLQDSDTELINSYEARVYNSAKYVETNTNNHYLYYGRTPNGRCNTALVQPLTDDIAGLTTATSGQNGVLKQSIDSMQANGNTDLSTGLEWAMHSLTPWAPLEGAGSFEDTQKIMVFMTDGDNFINYPDYMYWNYHSFGFWYDDPLRKGWTSEPTSAQAHDALNQATKDYCTAIKSRGVTIYFIYFGNASAAATSIVNHCASTSETAIIATNTQEVIAAFDKIGDDIGKLRLTAFDDG